MIKSGFASREALLRMFGIHHGHLKGMQILFAHYETDGLSSGEAWVLLCNVKTNDLLCVHATHDKVINSGFFSSFKGAVYRDASIKKVFKDQWMPKLILPEVALKIDPIKENFRIARILKNRIRHYKTNVLLVDAARAHGKAPNKDGVLRALLRRAASKIGF